MDCDNRKAVLWDLDGTLVDSGPHHLAAWQHTLATEGIEMTEERFRETFGQRNDRVLRRLFGPELNHADGERIAATKEQCFRDLIRAHGIALLPGALAWLDTLQVEGWGQALATSAPRANVDAVLEALGVAHRFGAVIAAEDVTQGKPHPEVFLTAAAQIGACPNQCVVVEDAPAGIEAARRAGMRVIGLGSATHQSGPDYHCEHLAELPRDLFDWLLAR
jgi:beta-phosphoglucomutase family hydrolase